MSDIGMAQDETFTAKNFLEFLKGFVITQMNRQEELSCVILYFLF